MKKILILVLLFFMIPFASLSAKGNYNYGRQVIFGGSDRDDLSKVLKVSDGYILVGNTSSSDGDLIDNNPKTTYDIFTMKLDNDLNVVWQKRIGTNLNSITANSVIETKDKGVVVVGAAYETSESDFSDAFIGRRDAVIVKYDKDGKKLWDHLYGKANTDVFNSIVEDKSGNLIAVGAISESTGYDVSVTKYSSNGNLLEEKSFSGSESESASVIIPALDGGFIIGGDTRSSDGDMVPKNSKTTSTSPFIMKIDDTLNKVWLKKDFGSSYNGRINDIKQTKDNAYILTQTFSGQYGSTYVYKVDKDGNIIWKQKYTSADSGQLHDINLTSDGGYIFSGTVGSDKDVDDVFNGTSGTDGFVTKTDAEGNVEWQDLYGAIDNQDNVIYAEESDDGTYTIFGNTDGNDGDIVEPVNGSNDIFITKFNNIPTITSEPEKDANIFSNKTDQELISLFNVKALDKEDGDITSEVVVDQSKVDYTKLGTYNVKFYIKDHSGLIGNEDSIDVKLNIINDKPTINSDPEKEVHIFETKTDQELISLFNVQALDTEDGDLNKDIVVDQSAVDYTKLGTYDVSFSVNDKMGEKAEVIAKLKVVNDPPKLTGLSVKEVDKGVVLSDADLLSEFNISATDYEDGDITTKVVVDQSAVDYTKVGNYPVTFEVSDSLNEKDIFKATLRIKDLTPDLIANDEVEIGLGNALSEEEIKKLFNAQAIDPEDGNISDKIVVDLSGVDFNTEGTYTIVFSIKDSANNYIEKKVQIKIAKTVTPEPNDKDNGNEDNNNKENSSKDKNNKGNSTDNKLMSTGSNLNVIVLLILTTLILIKKYSIKTLNEK